MLKTKLLKYTVIFTEESEGGYTVTVPSLPGCVTYGKTIKEAERSVKDAIKLYLESLEAHKEKIPQEKSSFVGSVDLEYSPTHA